VGRTTAASDDDDGEEEGQLTCAARGCRLGGGAPSIGLWNGPWNGLGIAPWNVLSPWGGGGGGETERAAKTDMTWCKYTLRNIRIYEYTPIQATWPPVWTFLLSARL